MVVVVVVVGAPLNYDVSVFVLNESSWEEGQERGRERDKVKSMYRVSFRVSKMDSIHPLGSTNFLTKFHGDLPFGF